MHGTALGRLPCPAGTITSIVLWSRACYTIPQERLKPPSDLSRLRPWNIRSRAFSCKTIVNSTVFREPSLFKYFPTDIRQRQTDLVSRGKTFAYEFSSRDNVESTIAFEEFLRDIEVGPVRSRKEIGSIVLEGWFESTRSINCIRKETRYLERFHGAVTFLKALSSK